MAHQFLVFDNGHQADTRERYQFLPDSFAFWPLLFPLPWLLIKQLWLEAALLVGAYAALAMLSAGGDVFWLVTLYVFNSVAALLVACEGRNWVIEKAIRRGAKLHTVVEADNREEAEIRFALAGEVPVEPAPAQTPTPLLGRSRSNEPLFATPWGHQ